MVLNPSIFWEIKTKYQLTKTLNEKPFSESIKLIEQLTKKKRGGMSETDLDFDQLDAEQQLKNSQEKFPVNLNHESDFEFKHLKTFFQYINTKHQMLIAIKEWSHYTYMKQEA